MSTSSPPETPTPAPTPTETPSTGDAQAAAQEQSANANKDKNNNNGRDKSNGKSGRNNRGTKNGKGNSRPTTTTPAFRGNTTEMNGHVFQCYAEANNRQQYRDTVKALAEYINKHLEHPRDVASLCQSGKLTQIPEPTDLTDEETKSEVKLLIRKAKVTAYVQRVDKQASNLQAIYSVAWGQCSPSMQAKLQTLPEFEARDADWDCAWLLREIQGITHMFEGTRNRYLSIDDARSKYENCRQGTEESTHDYMKRFKTCVEWLEHYGATIGNYEILTSAELVDGKDEPDKSANAADFKKQQVRQARNKSIAMAFLKRADRKRFGTLWVDLMNLCSRGQDQYPTEFTGAYNLLINYKTTGTPKTDGAVKDELAGTMFLQQTAKGPAGEEPSEATGPPKVTEPEHGMTPGTDGTTYDEIVCFRCKRRGHYRGQCPNPDPRDVTMLQHDPASNTNAVDDAQGVEWPAFSFAQATADLIPPQWILLDSQSTVSVFKTKRFLKNIRQSRTPLRVQTNGGTQVSTLVGDINNFGQVWYNPKSLANILSMAAVRKVCRITMDTAVEPALFVHRKDGTTMKFTEYKSGLYYYDASKPPQAPTNQPTSTPVTPYSCAYMFINTVDDNKQQYTRGELERADAARALFRHLDCPSYPRFEYYLRNNLIRNCPVTVDDVRRALHIYGPDPAALKGKTVNKGSHHVETFVPVRPQAPILHLHQDVTLCLDILYINGIPFITTTSRKLHFKTISSIANRSKSTLARETKSVRDLYEAHGFNIVNIHADQEFEYRQRR